ncbi:excalibur calcium-binding domain-containing protein [Paenibacillus sp. FSL R7-0026]|uniref:excalibur calcium-binding domain-containing protein n=1 Tax=Paenibacillus sp. FSL R7-0026 TaxID=2921668 RepID=UPI0030FC4363
MFILFVLSAVSFLMFLAGIISTFFFKSLVGKMRFFATGFLVSFIVLVFSLLMIPGSDNSVSKSIDVTTPEQQSVNTIAPVKKELSKWDSPQCAEAKEQIQEIRDSNTSSYSFKAIPNVGSIIEPCVDFSDTSSPPVSGNWFYENCSEAFEYGVSNIRTGEEGYADHLDRDNDGIACER